MSKSSLVTGGVCLQFPCGIFSRRGFHTFFCRESIDLPLCREFFDCRVISVSVVFVLFEETRQKYILLERSVFISLLQINLDIVKFLYKGVKHLDFS